MTTGMGNGKHESSSAAVVLNAERGLGRKVGGLVDP